MSACRYSAIKKQAQLLRTLSLCVSSFNIPLGFYHPRRLPIVYHLIPTPSQVISAFGLRLDLLDGSDPQGLSGAGGKHTGSKTCPKSKALAVVCQLNP